MSVWDEIDKLKRSHERDLKHVHAELERCKSGAFKVDDYGFWNASYQGGVEKDHRVRRVRSQTSAGLLQQITKLFDTQQAWLEARRKVREEAKKKREEERAANKKQRIELRAQRRADRAAKLAAKIETKRAGGAA